MAAEQVTRYGWRYKMAITLVQGTLNPASTQKARDIRQALATSFTGISGWTLVDHNYVNGTAERSVITNSAGFAFMIVNSTTLSDNNVYFALGDSYNDITHTLNKVAFHGDSTFGNIASTDSLGYSTFNTNPNAAAITNIYGNSNFGGIGIVGTTSQTNWTAHIDTDMVVFGVKTGTFADHVYLGAITSLVGNVLVTDNKPYTIVGKGISGNFDNLSGMLNNPAMPNVTMNIRNFSYLRFSTPGYGAPASTSYADKYSSQPTLSAVSDVYLGRRFDAPDSNANLYGFLRGKLKGVKFTQTANANWGDNITIAGKTYMYLGTGYWVGID